MRFLNELWSDEQNPTVTMPTNILGALGQLLIAFPELQCVTAELENGRTLKMER